MDLFTYSIQQHVKPKALLAARMRLRSLNEWKSAYPDQ
jgi:hypothetical protein